MRSRKAFDRTALALSVLLSGCPQAASNLPPNLHYVGGGLWRSGQPATRAQWASVQKLGVSTVVKLNYDSEGSDKVASELGMTVVKLPLEPAGDSNPIEALGNVLKPVDSSRLVLIGNVLATASPEHRVLVHCTHGQDRTGLVVARYRVMQEGWSAAQAEGEMLRLGFHPELIQLTVAWAKFVASR
jgi:tyrosine-protein phosphatase SIW14